MTKNISSFPGVVDIEIMTEFPFTWQVARTKNYHKIRKNYVVSIHKINEEWSLECLWREYGEGPDILEIRRNTKEQDILISGTFKMMNGAYWGSSDLKCVLQRKFIQLIEADYETIQIELQYPKDKCSGNSVYSITGTLTVPAYFSHKEYIEGAQIQSLLNLSTEFECLLDPKTAHFSDVKLNCETESFPVHKNILSARSPVFATMFTTEMKENIENKVEITDISPNVLKTMLAYIYIGKIGKLNYEFAGELLFAADKYQLQDLKRLCSNYLAGCMSTQNVLNTLVLGYLHDKELKVFTMNFICNTCLELEVMEKKEEWKTLCQKSPDLAIDVLSRLVKFKEKKMNGK